MLVKICGASQDEVRYSPAECLGTLGEPGLNLADAQGKLRAALHGSTDGPSLQIADAAGFKVVTGSTDLQTISTGEAHRTSAASAILFGKDGKILWSAP
ncbi:MAG: hypothetical protein ACLQOO_36370 [Terriglobia bacterium]